MATKSREKQPEPQGFPDYAIKILKARYYLKNDKGEFLGLRRPCIEPHEQRHPVL